MNEAISEKVNAEAEETAAKKEVSSEAQRAPTMVDNEAVFFQAEATQTPPSAA